MMQESLHRREKTAVISRRRKDRTTIAESILDTLSLIIPRQIVQRHLRTALRLENLSQLQSGRRRTPVDGSICNENTFCFHPIGTPSPVQIQIIIQVLTQDRAVQRTDAIDIQGSRLLQQRLDRTAILAADIEIIPPRLARPVIILIPEETGIQGPELTESIRREQHLVSRIVRNQHFRPVHHRRSKELKTLGTQIQHFTLLHYERPTCKIKTFEELSQHLERPGRNDQL